MSDDYTPPEKVDWANIKADQPPASDDYTPAHAVDWSQVKPYTPRSAVGEVANQLKAGTLVDLPQVVGQGAEFGARLAGLPEGNIVSRVGKRIAQFGNEQAARPDLQPEPEAHNVVTNALAGGARMLPQSVVPPLAAGAAIAALPFELPEAAVVGGGALLGVLPGAGSQGEQTFEAGQKAGLSDEASMSAARKTAAIEGGGELAANIVGARLLGVGGKVGRAIVGSAEKPVAQAALEEATRPSVVKPFLKHLGEAAVVEPATEFGQQYGEAAVEQQAGIPQDQSPLEQGVSVVAPTLGMTALLAPFGLAGHGLKARAVARRGEALASGATAPEDRAKAAQAIHDEIAQADPAAARNFAMNANNAISRGVDLPIDENILKAPQPQLALPAPSPVAAGQAADVQTSGPSDAEKAATQFYAEREAEVARRTSAMAKGQPITPEEAAGHLAMAQDLMRLASLAQNDTDRDNLTFRAQATIKHVEAAIAARGPAFGLQVEAAKPDAGPLTKAVGRNIEATPLALAGPAPLQALPSPEHIAPGAPLAVDSAGGAFPQTYGEQAAADRARQEQDSISGKPIGIQAPPHEIRAPSGDPFTTMPAANKARANLVNPDQYEPIKLGARQFVLRAKEQETTNATTTGQQPESRQQEHQRVSPGPDVRQNSEEVRQGQGEQAGSGGGVQPGAQVEASAAGDAAQNRADVVKQYRAKAKELSGNENHFGADIAKELFPEYAASNEARRAQSPLIQEQAAKIAADSFADALAKPVTPKTDTVTFMAGGTGSGKSTHAPKTGIVYDSTLTNFDVAKEKIDAALASGRDVDIRYVFREPVEAYSQGVLKRAESIGRSVAPETHANTHRGAYETIQRLADQYKDDKKRVHIRLIDNSGLAAKRVSVLPEQGYNGLNEKLAEIDRQAGRGQADTVARRDRQAAESQAAGQGGGVPENAERPGQVPAQVLNKTPPQGGVSASAPAKGRKQAFVDERLTDTARAQLQHMANEAGWQEIGGRIVRASDGSGGDQSRGGRPTGEVIGRTSWVPNAPWFQRIQSTAGLPLNKSGAATRRAVTKALAGESIRTDERRHVQAMLDELDAMKAEAEHEAQHELDETLLSAAMAETKATDPRLAGLAIRANEVLGEDEAERLAAQHEKDEDYIHAVEQAITEKLKPATGASSGEVVPETGARKEGEKSEALALTSQTEESRRAEERARAAAEAEQTRKDTEARQKAEADRARESFTLSGSNAEADQAAAAGQQDLLAAPKREESPKQSESAASAVTGITDVGEKIGAARKDTADRGYTLGGKKTATDDERPTWAKRFDVSQIVKAAGQINAPYHEGRWVIRDKKNTDFMDRPRQVGETFATKEEAEAFLPMAAVAVKHRVRSASDGKYEIWRNISDRKSVKVVDQSFDSREAANEYMARHAAEILETNTTFGEADLPKSPDRQRTGAQRRTGDVKGDDFMQSFGLRGVEFGNWNNQAERQALMNDAYDGMMDLADVLGVPPKALGLNGDLALAFGARGHGLSSARAHYELNRAVINLTKENGAGSLAHEWFHAFDAYLGRQDGKASSEWTVAKDGTRTLKADSPSVNATHGFRIRDSGVREEVRQAYTTLVNAIFKKGTKYVEDAEKADDFAGRTRTDLQTQLDKLRAGLAEQKDPTYWKRNNKPASAELLAEFDTIAKRMLDGEAQSLATDWRKIEGSKAKIAARWTNDSLERLNAIYKEVRGRSGFDSQNQGGIMDSLRGYMNRYSQRLKMLADAQQGTEKTKMVPTDFAMNAKELDQGRGGEYWTTPHEMAARAFQGFVEDKIAEGGNTSRFLNYAPENGGILTPWGVKFPYPRGTERKAINTAVEAFTKTLETKETDKGTALFSRYSLAQDGKPAGIPVTEAQRAVDNFKAEFGRGLKGLQFSVEENPPAHWTGGTATARGAYFPASGRVVLVAANLRDARDARITLRHEVLAHFGLNTLTPETKREFLTSIVETRGNARFSDLWQQIDKDYPDKSESLRAEELFAKLAQEERGPLSELFNRFATLLGKLLRRIGFIKGIWSPAELRDVARTIADGVRNGASQRTFPKTNDAQFSRDAREQGMPHTAGDEPLFSIESDGGKRDLGERLGEFFHKPQSVPRWVKAMSPEMQEALRKSGVWAQKKSLKDRMREVRQDAGLKVLQGVVDQFAPVLKRLGDYPYKLLRMSASSDAGLEASLVNGRLKVNSAGALEVERGTKGLLEILKPLNGEVDRFFSWIAGNRADQLAKEDREHLFGDADIAQLKQLNRKLHESDNFPNGADAKGRVLTYAKVLHDYNEFSKSILDIAEKNGIINGDSRKLWEKQFYVPFFRETEDQRVTAPGNLSGMVNQYAFKKLKGGEGVLHDLLANTMQNWSHLLSAALKNKAATETLRAAENLGAARKLTADEKGSVYVLDDGKKVHYAVDDPLILDAISSLGATPFGGRAMRAFGMFKHALTVGTTASPTFRIRHTIREQITALAANPTTYNFVKNWMDGFKYSSRNNPEYGNMLAGGSFFRMGQNLEADRAAYVKRLIADNVDQASVLDDPNKIKAALTHAWDWWKEVGERSDSITRANIYRQVYERLKKEGANHDKAHFEAAYAARDVMDYGLRGTWPAIRMLTQMVPFMNARLQGLYKLGRGAADDPARFAAVVGGVTLASIALMLAYRGDPDWEKREEWDRDNFWWFKIGQKAFRIPKPFEVGALASVMERATETAINGFDKESRDRFIGRLLPTISAQLNLNPIPQTVYPLIELWANKDVFTGRHIESEHEMNLPTAERIGSRTTPTAQLLGKAGILSPEQIDFLVNAYFGWVGAHAVATADLALRPLMGLPAKPTPRTEDYFLIGDFVKDLPSNQSRFVTEFYDNLKQVQQSFDGMRALQQAGQMEKAAEYMKEHGDEIKLHSLFTHTQHQLGLINRRIRYVQMTNMEPDEKRAELDRLTQTRNRLAETVTKTAEARQQ